MVYSTSGIYALDRFGDSTFFLKRHLIFLTAGFLFMFFLMSVTLSQLERTAKALIFFSILMLILVLIPGIGSVAGGARRWFRYGPLSFQPSEFAKFSLIVYLASYINRKGYHIKDLLTGFLPPVILIAICGVLILAQPDLGMSVSIFFIGFLFIFISGARWKHILPCILFGALAFYYLVLSVPYRRDRIMIFLNPWQDERGAGFQIIQSFLALGSGGLFGVGLGQSKQKLFYLPESHTDFVFSIIGEELGFLGTSTIILLFGILIYLFMKGSSKVTALFPKTLIMGFIIMFTSEIILNIGVATGIFPTKGLPLPFISYGGTSLIFHLGAVGLILNAMREV